MFRCNKRLMCRQSDPSSLLRAETSGGSEKFTRCLDPPALLAFYLTFPSLLPLPSVYFLFIIQPFFDMWTAMSLLLWTTARLVLTASCQSDTWPLPRSTQTHRRKHLSAFTRMLTGACVHTNMGTQKITQHKVCCHIQFVCRGESAHPNHTLPLCLPVSL